MRPDAVQAVAPAGAWHGGLQDGRERAPAVPPHRCDHCRPAAGPSRAPARRRRRRRSVRPAGLHRGAAGRDGEQRRRREGLHAGGPARPRAGVRAPHRRDEDDGVHAIVGGVPGFMPPARGGEAAPGAGRLRAAGRARAGRRRAPEQVPLPRPGHQGGHAVPPRVAAHRQADIRARRDRRPRPPKGNAPPPAASWLKSHAANHQLFSVHLQQINEACARTAGRVRVAGAGGAGAGRGAVPGAGGVPAGAVRGGGGGGAGAAPVRAHPVRRRAEGVHRTQVRAAAGEARRGGALPPVRVPALAGHGVAHPVRLRPRPRLPLRRQAEGHPEGVKD